MLSRVAERIYWMARYIERAENIARLINVNTLMLLDLPRGVPLGWEALIDMTGRTQRGAFSGRRPAQFGVAAQLAQERARECAHHT